MKWRLAVFGTYWLVASMVIPTECAWAYIDPATTTYIIQIAAAVVITLGVSLGVFLYKFQMIVTNVKVSVHALMRRLRHRRDEVGGKNAPAKNADHCALSEEEALAAGVIDYPIPVRDTYPALAVAGEYAGNATGEEDIDVKCASDADGVLPATEASAYPSRIAAFGRWLWNDDRTVKERLLKAVAIAAALSMTFVIFGMLDSVLQNETKLTFSFAEVAGPVCLLGFVVFIVAAGILALLRGRAFDFAVCLFLSLLVCGYVQSTFMNAGIGQLTGEPLGWGELGAANVVGNIALWVAVIAVTFFLGFRRRTGVRTFYGTYALLVPSLLFAVQFVALLSIVPPSEEWDANESGGTKQVLTTKDMYGVSSGSNVIVFVLDTLDEKFINSIAEEDPTFFDNLDGFTRFTNNVGAYNATFPSVIHMFTGVPLDIGVTSAAYTEYAYSQGTFIEDIHNQGFVCDLYMEKNYTYSDGAQLEGLADNLEAVTYEADTAEIIGNLIRLEALKCAPLALKAQASIHPNTFTRMGSGVQIDGNKPYAVDDPGFYQKLKDDKLTFADKSNHFAYYHLNGAHPPWTMDAAAQYSEEETSSIEQTKGCFLILEEYFAQMKSLGIYDDATIIITGDHSTHMLSKEPSRPLLVGLFVKPAGSAGTPLAYNSAPVSIANLGATCVSAAGGDPTPWGRTYFDVDENEYTERHYFSRYTTEDARTHYLVHFRIDGDARKWENWHLIETTPYDTKNWF